MRIALSLLAMVLASAVSPVDAAGSNPPLWAKEGALTRWVFGREANVADAPLACVYQAGPCVPGPTHLSFAPPAPIPTRDACSAGTATLKACYNGAVTRLQAALDGGDVLGLLEAGHRIRELGVRADNTGMGPAWLKTAAPGNLLARFFEDQGMPLSSLGGCHTGTSADRFACMGAGGGPVRAVFRSAIGALDHHVNVRVNHGLIAGAIDRLEQIFVSATAPTVSGMTAANRLDPTLGQGLHRMDLLGKILYLRTLTGVSGPSIKEDKAYIAGVAAYHPPNKPAVESRLALFAAQRAAARWDAGTGTRLILDAELEGDLRALADNLHTAAQLELVRGDVAGATLATELMFYMGATFTAVPFDVGVIDRFARPLDWFTNAPFDFHYTGLCEWFTFEDITRSFTLWYPETVTKRAWIPDCLDCDTGSWFTWTETEWVQGPTTTVVIGTEIFTESVRENYAQLLDSDDSNEVDVNTNGIPDIDFSNTQDNDASMAHAGVNAQECLAELENFSGAYGDQRIATDLACNGDVDCQDSYGASFDGWLFLPYGMASRLCPTFTASAVGIDSVTLVDGELTGVSNSCPTPLEYVATVGELLAEGDSALLDELEIVEGPLETLLADFAAEAIILTVPVAGMFRQHADLAYFSSEALAGCGDTAFGDCVGLDVLDARLSRALDAVGKGLAAFDIFVDVDRPANNLDGIEAIANGAVAGVDACSLCAPGAACAGCQPGSYDSNRALAYRRLREAVSLYHSIRTDQLEVQWRRIDAMPGTCIATADVDGDGVEEHDCVDTDPACTGFCTSFDSAVGVVAETARDLDGLTDALADQQAVLEAAVGGDELASFVGEITTYSEAIGVALDADLAALTRNVDWLGDRKGRWAVVPYEDPVVESDAVLADLEQAAVDFGQDYDLWVGAYLDQLAQEATFSQTALDVAAQTSNAVASFCHHLSDGTPAPSGCGNGSEFNLDNPVAERVNQTIEDNFCNVTVQSLPIVTIDLGIDCPKLETLNFDAMIANKGGSLIDVNVVAMNQALIDVEAAARDFHNYVELMQDVSAIYASYENAITTYFEHEAFKEWLGDVVVCGAAAIGAVAASIGSTGAAAVPAWIGAAATCTQRFVAGSENLFPDDGNMSAEELSFEASYINQEVHQMQQLYDVTVKIETLLQAVADYEAAVLSYRSQLAAFQRAIAYSDETLDNLDNYAAFDDPVYLQFAGEQLGNVKGSFRVYARMLQDARRRIEYDMGNLLPNGGNYDRMASESYWMPRLADLTILSSYGASYTSAWSNLATTVVDGSDVGDADLNLVTASSLLGLLYDDFRLVYGERRPASDAALFPAFVGSDIPGLEDSNGDGLQDVVGGELAFANTGELALIGDSRFYDPRGVGACPAGSVDVSDYCTQFSNDATRVPAAGNCASVLLMPTDQRLDLAHLAHMVRTPGTHTFDCTIDAAGTTFTIAAGHGTGAASRFTAADQPIWDSDETDWIHGLVGTFDETFYLAQTPEVRAVMDRYLDGLQDETLSLSAAVNFLPGSFAYQVDMQSAVFEPEADLLFDADPAANATMSEEIEGIAVLCTSSTSCGGEAVGLGEGNATSVVMFGPGYKGNRCRYDQAWATDAVGDPVLQHTYGDGDPRQEQLQFLADHDLVTAYSGATTAPESFGSGIVTDLLEASWVGRRPLHSTAMVVVLSGIYDANLNAYANPWALYQGGTEPRLRIAVSYSYYQTEKSIGAPDFNVAGFLKCGDSTVASPM